MKKLLLLIVLPALLFLGACEHSTAPTPTADQQNAAHQQSLVERQPAPTLNFSNERQNLIDRYKRFNDPNKVGYIYLFSHSGTIVDYSDVKGKISNLSSNLDPQDRIVCEEHGYQGRASGCVSLAESEPDGSYAGNGEGIFFFDTKGVYHEWHGDYDFTDQPRAIAQQPVLVVTADAQQAAKQASGK